MPGTPRQLADAPHGDTRLTPQDAAPKRTRQLAAALITVGLWGILAPYAGPEVDVSSTVEFVDHVVPGAIVVTTAIFAIQRGASEFLTAAVGLLAALWMTVTHIPLVAAAARDQTPWDGAIWMFVPSALLLLLTGLAAASAWKTFR
ncbi:MAG: hypothetical protein ACLGI5_19430 [Thermoleophilia bacterium]